MYTPNFILYIYRPGALLVYFLSTLIYVMLCNCKLNNGKFTMCFRLLGVVGFFCIYGESNSLIAFHLLHKDLTPHYPCFPLVEKFYRFKAMIGQLQWNHISATQTRLSIFYEWRSHFLTIFLHNDFSSISLHNEYLSVFIGRWSFYSVS